MGNGLFKPNMTSIISNAYESHPEKKMVLILYTIWGECWSFLRSYALLLVLVKISWSWDLV
jgi:POT family proton-dependent oligopeptide transporter